MGPKSLSWSQMDGTKEPVMVSDGWDQTACHGLRWMGPKIGARFRLPREDFVMIFWELKEEDAGWWDYLAGEKMA